MIWIFAALIGYLFLAGASFLDKVLLSGLIGRPATFTFLSHTLALLVFVLAPWYLTFPSLLQFYLALAAGAMFALALFGYYNLVQKNEVSRIVPAIAAFLPIFSLLQSTIFFEEQLTLLHYFAFILLVVGGVAITHQKGAFVNKNVFAVALVALCFSVSFILTKEVFNAQPFWSGFMWMRLGGFLFSLLFLMSSSNRIDIFRIIRAGSERKTSPLFFLNQGFATGGFLLQNYAFALGSVPLVNALESTKYVFLFVFTFLATVFYPNILRETISVRIIIAKLSGIAIIATGLILLFL